MHCVRLSISRLTGHLFESRQVLSCRHVPNVRGHKVSAAILGQTVHMSGVPAVVMADTLDGVHQCLVNGSRLIGSGRDIVNELQQFSSLIHLLFQRLVQQFQLLLRTVSAG